MRTRMSRMVAVTVYSLVAAQAAAQDPTRLLPESYKIRFENEWVRVTRVHYEPHAKLPPHAHTTAPSAYVYLNDGGPVIFKHIGLSYGAITRPATVARGFRLYKNVQEIHEVENPNDTPSDFLRVEFKTEPVEEATLRGRFLPEVYPPDENFTKVHFENGQVKVSRRACAPRRPCDVSPMPSTPAFVVALTPAHLKDVKGHVDLEAGDTLWLAEGTTRVVENVGTSPAEVLVFELKSKPVPEKSSEGH